ncbi:hypothetical protein NX059_005749 [Plenodomus lindquistii]|nr:hypothetical protein NX059_005749 [Plenodomus lindquistii]
MGVGRVALQADSFFPSIYPLFSSKSCVLHTRLLSLAHWYLGAPRVFLPVYHYFPPLDCPRSNRRARSATPVSALPGYSSNETVFIGRKVGRNNFQPNMLITRGFSLTNFVIGSSALCFQVFVLYPWHEQLDAEFKTLRKEHARLLEDTNQKHQTELNGIREELRKLNEQKKSGRFL